MEDFGLFGTKSALFLFPVALRIPLTMNARKGWLSNVIC